MITAGPTREPIDPVRFISNHSSGKQGYAIAEAAVALGAETVLVSGPICLADPAGRADDAGRDGARDAQDLRGGAALRHRHLHRRRRRLARGVRRGREAEEGGGRAAGDSNSPKTPTFSQPSRTRKTERPALVVGFAAETQNVIDNAQEKLAKKGCDLIVANDVSAGKGVFGGDRNEVHLVSAAGVESWPNMSKAEVARRLMDRLAAMLHSERCE